MDGYGVMTKEVDTRVQYIMHVLFIQECFDWGQRCAVMCVEAMVRLLRNEKTPAPAVLEETCTLALIAAMSAGK